MQPSFHIMHGRIEDRVKCRFGSKKSKNGFNLQRFMVYIGKSKMIIDKRSFGGVNLKTLRKGLKVSTVTTLALGLMVGCSSTSTPTSTGIASPTANTPASSTAPARPKRRTAGRK